MSDNLKLPEGMEMPDTAPYRMGMVIADQALTTLGPASVREVESFTYGIVAQILTRLSGQLGTSEANGVALRLANSLQNPLIYKASERH